jgi:VanZ family protein
MQWAPTAFWMGAIAAFSTDTFSAAHTGYILRKIIDAIYPAIPAQWFEALHFFVRKSAHFTVYGILSWLAFVSWRVTLPAPRRWTFTWSWLALALTLFVAILDEFHQNFIPSRSSSLRDVTLDMTGALFFQLVLGVFLSRRKRERL